MALTPTESAQYTAQNEQTRVQGIYASKIHYKYAKFTATASGTGTASMMTLPPGRIAVIPHLCRVVTNSAWATNSDLHIGYAAHTNQDGTAVSADDNAWLENGDAGGGALNTFLSIPATAIHELNSKQGIDVEILVDTGNIETNDWVEVCMAYMLEN